MTVTAAKQPGAGLRILLLDKYDSFTYNLYQYLAELGADVRVHDTWAPAHPIDAVAARVEREHERAATPIYAQRHGSVGTHPSSVE